MYYGSVVLGVHTMVS